MLGGAYFAKCNHENIIGNIRASARNSWELLRITGVGICISRNFSRRKRLCGGYAFCTIGIYDYVRLVRANKMGHILIVATEDRREYGRNNRYSIP